MISTILSWLQTAVFAVPDWLNQMGEAIGVPNWFSILVGLTCVGILARYLIFPAVGGHAGASDDGTKQSARDNNPNGAAAQKYHH